MKKTFLLTAIISASYLCAAQSWQDTVGMAEQIFSRYKPAGPGCQLAISRNGKIIFSKAWGMADLEHNVPLTTESVIEAGSVSKQFTAACILLLEQQGKLSLDDDVRKYLPEIPDYGKPILLRHMMYHTSGLKDWESIIELTGFPVGDKVYDNDDALFILSRQKTLNNRPGVEFLYSNSNYTLFAIIVERVSGMDLAEFSRKYIFGPAGMTHTRWRNHFRDIVPNRAIAYGYNGSYYFNDMPNENAYGNNGLLTTAKDLITWNNYYLSGKLGKPSLLSKQLEIDSLHSDGNAGGLSISSFRGSKMIWFSGATTSYRCFLKYFPASGLSFAWLSNSSQFDRDIGVMNSDVCGIFIKDIQVPEQKKATTQPVISYGNLTNYAGWYRSNLSGQGLRLFVEDGKLSGPGGKPFIAVAENIFQMADGAKLVFWPSEKRGFLSIYPHGDTTYFAAADSVRLTSDTMKDYEGEYYSDEVGTKFSITIKEHKLILHQDPHSDEPLEPTYKDGFSYWRGTLYFERDKQHMITGMKISLPRARNLAFKKL